MTAATRKARTTDATQTSAEPSFLRPRRLTAAEAESNLAALDRATAFRNALFLKYGRMGDSVDDIREMREERGKQLAEMEIWLPT